VVLIPFCEVPAKGYELRFQNLLGESRKLCNAREAIRIEIRFALPFEHWLRRHLSVFFGNSRKAEIATLAFYSEEQKVQAGYWCRISPDGLFFRNNAIAMPRNPVPSSSKDEGSGVSVRLPWKSMPAAESLV
jgi:hypothetical protein